mmetsp:Transcript_73603/g.124015  ORF Transcript_73603/g.124015 Transcript_73603/m.124015 type:complete len:482 (-) Transcript_73603:124-1569(-)
MRFHFCGQQTDCHQRRDTIRFSLEIGVGPGFQKQGADLQRPFGASCKERGLVIFAGLIDEHAGPQHLLHNSRRGTADCNVERGIGLFDLPGLEQEADNLLPVLGDCGNQRCARTVGPDLCLLSNQQLDQLRVAVLTGQHQRRAPLRGSHLHVPSCTVDHLLHDPHIAPHGRKDHRCQPIGTVLIGVSFVINQSLCDRQMLLFNGQQQRTGSILQASVRVQLQAKQLVDHCYAAALNGSHQCSTAISHSLISVTPNVQEQLYKLCASTCTRYDHGVHSRIRDSFVHRAAQLQQQFGDCQKLAASIRERCALGRHDQGRVVRCRDSLRVRPRVQQRLQDRQPTPQRSQKQWRVSKAGGSVNLGTSLDQSCNGLGVTTFGCSRQRNSPLGIGLVRISSISQQEIHNFCMSESRSSNQGSVPIGLLAGVDVCFLIKQFLHFFYVSTVRSTHQLGHWVIALWLIAACLHVIRGVPTQTSLTCGCGC